MFKPSDNYIHLQKKIVFISHVSKVMLKILHARFQQYVNQELPDIQTGLRKDRGTRGQTVNYLLDHRESRQQKISTCFIDYAKAFGCVDHIKLWKALKEMGIPDQLTCLLRNLYVSQKPLLEPCM